LRRRGRPRGLGSRGARPAPGGMALNQCITPPPVTLIDCPCRLQCLHGTRTMTTRITWTYEDYAALPDDGKRYEVHAGALVMLPAPGSDHQVVVPDPALTTHRLLVIVRAA